MNRSLSPTWQLRLASEDDTDQLARVLIDTAPANGVVLLRGTLGAGKTRLVRGMAVAVGIPSETVVSPTFVLCQTYEGTRTLYHLDAYRLNDDDEFLELGVDEMMDSEAITLVEWGDKVVACLPSDRLDVELQVTGEATRAARLDAGGPQCAAWLERAQRNWSAAHDLSVSPDANSEVSKDAWPEPPGSTGDAEGAS